MSTSIDIGRFSNRDLRLMHEARIALALAAQDFQSAWNAFRPERQWMAVGGRMLFASADLAAPSQEDEIATAAAYPRPSLTGYDVSAAEAAEGAVAQWRRAQADRVAA